MAATAAQPGPTSPGERILQELRATALKVCRQRVARLMPHSALKAKTRLGFRPCRNSTSNTAGIAENLLQLAAAGKRYWERILMSPGARPSQGPFMRTFHDA